MAGLIKRLFGKGKHQPAGKNHPVKIPAPRKPSDTGKHRAQKGKS